MLSRCGLTLLFQRLLLRLFASYIHNTHATIERTLEQKERARRYSGFYCLSSNHNRYVLHFQYKTIKKSRIRLTPSSDWRLGIKRF